jgi:hypothetical protein
MERRRIGEVQDLFRYPVKSMRRERLSAVDIDIQGIIGDRAYALCEPNGRVVTAKSGPICLSSARGMTHHKYPEHWRHFASPRRMAGPYRRRPPTPRHCCPPCWGGSYNSFHNKGSFQP